MRQGVVARFDDEVGLGTVRTEDGAEFGFHCTEIADGSRHIEVGTPVRFSLRAGRGGRWEAAAVTASGSPDRGKEAGA